ncbi:hypothetical protein Q7C36_020355, partial [Tachysurus vachellii]
HSPNESGHSSSRSFTLSSRSSPGHIEIVPVELFSGGEKCTIFRKNDEIDVKTFKAYVTKRMKEEPEYNLWSSNCIHFAMGCLGLKASTWDNLLTGLGYNPKGFSVVKHYDDDYDDDDNRNYEIGDLFIVKTKFKCLYHTGVCYDEDLIVHFIMSKTFFISE